VIPANKAKKNQRIFLSYSAQDRPVARRIERRLEQHAGAEVFSPGQIPAGTHWESKLREALSDSDAFLLVASPDSLSSDWVLWELGAAWQLGKPILVVTTTDKTPRMPVHIPDGRVISLHEFETADFWEKLK
jgi:hypothetical protein